MKKNYFFTLLVAITFILSGCVDENKCTLECKNGGTAHQSGCSCDCPTGYTGNECQTLINLDKLHADVSIDGAPNFAYDPPTFYIKILDHVLTDTLWIDGFDDNIGSFCFMRLYINDLSTITPGSTYSIEGSNSLGTSWGTFKDPNQDPQPYQAKTTSSGTLTITTYQPGKKIAGTFDFYGYNGPSTAHIVGWFEGS